jgi:hypothetical protein
MVYSIEIHWISELCPSFCIPKATKQILLFLSTSQGRETPTLLGPLEKLTSVIPVLEYQTMDKVQKPSDCFLISLQSIDKVSFCLHKGIRNIILTDGTV